MWCSPNTPTPMPTSPVAIPHLANASSAVGFAGSNKNMHAKAWLTYAEDPSGVTNNERSPPSCKVLSGPPRRPEWSRLDIRQRQQQQQEVAVVGHIFQGPVKVDDIQHVFACHKNVLAPVAGGEAQEFHPLINVVVIQPVVEDDVANDAPPCLPIHYQDGINERANHGSIPHGDRVVRGGGRSSEVHLGVVVVFEEEQHGGIWGGGNCCMSLTPHQPIKVASGL